MRKVEWGTPWLFCKVLVLSVLNKHAENRAFAPNIPAVENKRVVLGEVCRNLSLAFAEVRPFRSAKVGVLPVIFLLPFAVFISLSFGSRPPSVFLPSSFGLVLVLLPSSFHPPLAWFSSSSHLPSVLLRLGSRLPSVFLSSSFGLLLIILPSSFHPPLVCFSSSFHPLLAWFSLSFHPPSIFFSHKSLFLSPFARSFFSFSPFPFPLDAYLRPPLCPRSAARLSVPSPQAL